MKPTVLYAWELGGNLGHVGQFVPLARRLGRGGVAVECALAFTGGVGDLLTRDGIGWLQAPVYRGARPDGVHATPISYADILLQYGYARVGDLMGLVGAWRRLLALTGATLVLADHAPTAILAARTVGTPVMLHGTGFYAPPDVAPAPAMRPWSTPDDAALAASEARALSTINTVLAAFGHAPLERVGQLFAVAEAALMTFPELDPYPRPEGGRYWGMPPSFGADPFAWPAGEGPRLFGYLRADHASTPPILAALARFRCRAVIFCPDLPAAARPEAPHMTFLTRGVDLGQAGREAHAAVLHASHGTTAPLLRAGVPMIMAPANLEQGLIAHRVEAMGAGLVVGGRGRAEDPRAALEAVLGAPEYGARARAFARRYESVRPEAVLETMAARALTLAGANG